MSDGSTNEEHDVAERALKAALQAEDAAERVAQLVTQLATLEPPSLATTVVLWFVCFASIVTAALLVERGVTAFQDPPPPQPAAGEVSVGINPTHASDASSQGRIDLNVIYNVTKSSVEYSFFFPRQYSGRKYQIVLYDKPLLANMQSIEMDDPSGGLSPKNRATECQVWPLAAHRKAPCQVIEGRLPGYGDAYYGTGSICNSSNNQQGFLVIIDGKRKLLIQLDWAHDVIRIPETFDPAESATPLDSEQFYWQEIWTDSCQTIKVPTGSTITDSIGAPVTTADGLTWSTPNGESAVVKHRNADSEGNSCLAAAGAIVSLGIGLVPVAFDASSKRYRALLYRQRIAIRRPQQTPPDQRAHLSGLSD